MAFKVFVTRNIQTAGLQLLQRPDINLDVFEGDDTQTISRDELLKRIAGCDAVLTMVTEKVDEAFLQAAGPNLKIIANYAVGYNNIDVPACTKAGVVVTNTPDVLTNATADQAMMLMLATARRAIEADAVVRQGKWENWGPNYMLGMDLTGKTVGLIGMGRIGLAFAKRAKAFEMNVIYHNRRPNPEAEAELNARYVSKEELLQQSDVVSLHMPLTTETKHLIGAAELAMMKPSAILINTARGPVIDEKALVHALQEKTIWAAGLDVFENEPSVEAGLLTLDNVVLAPHLGSATLDARNGMASLAASNIVAVLEGKAALTALNPEVLS